MLQNIYFLIQLKEKLSNRIEPSTMDIALQQLWHEHIRTITDTVKQLSRELETIKHEVLKQKNCYFLKSS